MTETDANVTGRMTPNILLITTDSQRCDTLACMGNPHAWSPNLDRLAAEGVVFDDAYTAAPVCAPARCSLVTGTHAHTHGAIENGIVPHDHLPVFPTLLREAGYVTMQFGKSHVGPLHPAYDVECDIAGEKGSGEPDPYTTFLAGHSVRRGEHPHPLPAHLHMESFLVDEAIAAIGKAMEHPERPFFAHCSLLSPHDPLDPPQPWDTRYDDRDLPEINYVPGEMDTHPALLHEVFRLREFSSRFHTPHGELERTAVDARRRRYYSLAAFCDHQVGRLLDWLDDQRLRENTLVIFTSDHGLQMFDHGFNNKHCFYDASWRVPMIISMPGTIPAGERRGFASWVDLAPTILAAAGRSSDSMQGYDLFTPLRDGLPSPRACAASTLYTSSAIVSASWKYEWYFSEATGRLYDRKADPDEQVNLFGSPDHQDVRASMHEALLLWRAETMDMAWLQSHTFEGGPVARNVAKTTRELPGNFAETRLNQRVSRVETVVGAPP